jgi:hypothetical protein
MNDPYYADDLFAITDPDERRVHAREMFSASLHAGEGYSVGGEDADPNLLAEDLVADLVTPAEATNPIAVYHAHDGRAVLVALSSEDSSLWAVDLLPRAEDARWLDQDFDALQDTTEREDTVTESTEWSGDEP